MAGTSANAQPRVAGVEGTRSPPAERWPREKTGPTSSALGANEYIRPQPPMLFRVHFVVARSPDRAIGPTESLLFGYARAVARSGDRATTG